jgi:two-component system LytT family response regulator
MDLKCIIIDDDQYAIDALVRYVNEMPGLSVHQTFLKPLEALVAIHEPVDFIFLDIEMPEISGLELAESLRFKTKFLIFTTSHPSYALKAFDLNANQYLLKPISFSKFALTINYLLKNNLDHHKTALETAKPAELIPKKDHLQFIKADQKHTYHYIDPNEIIYVAAAKNYVIIHTEKEQFVTHLGLNHIDEALSKHHFIRIYKSYLIAKRAIKKVEGSNIKLKNCELDFQLGEVYRPAFLAFINSSMMAQ